HRGAPAHPHPKNPGRTPDGLVRPGAGFLGQSGAGSVCGRGGGRLWRRRSPWLPGPGGHFPRRVPVYGEAGAPGLGQGVVVTGGKGKENSGVASSREKGMCLALSVILSEWSHRMLFLSNRTFYYLTE